MRFFNIVLLVVLMNSCSNEQPKSSVILITDMTHVNTTTTRHFIKKFYLVKTPPESIDVFKKLMVNISVTNIDTTYDDEKYVFVRDYGSEGGVDAGDILGTVKYTNKRGNRTITVNIDEGSFYSGDKWSLW